MILLKISFIILFSSVQFHRSVMSDSLWPHEPQHARLPCPSPTPGVYSNSCPSSWWCHPDISFSVVPFSSCPQSLPASGSFPMSQLFPWGNQSIGVSASASALPINNQDWFPLGWTGWTSLQSRGLSRVFSNTTIQKHRFFGAQLSSQSNSHIHTWPLVSIKSRCEKGKIKFLLASRFSISFSWIAGDEFWNLLFLWMTFPCLVNISLGIFCLILR